MSSLSMYHFSPRNIHAAISMIIYHYLTKHYPMCRLLDQLWLFLSTI